jgi:Tat protein secretion system quality control protein TatD with DNase activity
VRGFSLSSFLSPFHLLLSRLLIESDAPALAPIKPTKEIPQRNEPKNILISFKALCEANAKTKTEDEVAKALFENTKRLFPKC